MPYKDFYGSISLTGCAGHATCTTNDAMGVSDECRIVAIFSEARIQKIGHVLFGFEMFSRVP
jgi:hypothetical protein